MQDGEYLHASTGPAIAGPRSSPAVRFLIGTEGVLSAWIAAEISIECRSSGMRGIPPRGLSRAASQSATLSGRCKKCDSQAVVLAMG